MQRLMSLKRCFYDINRGHTGWRCGGCGNLNWVMISLHARAGARSGPGLNSGHGRSLSITAIQHGVSSPAHKHAACKGVLLRNSCFVTALGATAKPKQ